MAARPRARARRDWPKGLRETKPGYYCWEHPETHKVHAIGRVPLAEAKMQALEANLRIAGLASRPRLVDKLDGGAELTLQQWLTDWMDKLEGEGLAENTMRSYRSLSRAICAEPEDRPAGAALLRRCSVEVVSDCLEAIEENRGARTAQGARSLLLRAFNAAIAKGKCEQNPVAVTEGITVAVQRKRFTWETFSKVWALLEEQGPVWLRNAAALALVSGQRRDDVAAAMFTAFDDSEWKLIQQKTGRALAIPLDLRLEKLGMSLRDVLQACRRTGVVSRYLVHQTRPYGNSPVGAQIWIDTITKRFSEVVAEALGDAPHNPTFHELRSLAKRLYQAQGNVDTKALLGHETEEMSKLYADARGAEVQFQRVAIT